jgi:hypothetical protein
VVVPEVDAVDEVMTVVPGPPPPVVVVVKVSVPEVELAADAAADMMKIFSGPYDETPPPFNVATLNLCCVGVTLVSVNVCACPIAILTPLALENFSTPST